MSRKEENPRADIYARITNRIVADLERGVRPWVRPWGAADIVGRIPGPCATTASLIPASTLCCSGPRLSRAVSAPQSG